MLLMKLFILYLKTIFTFHVGFLFTSSAVHEVRGNFMDFRRRSNEQTTPTLLPIRMQLGIALVNYMENGMVRYTIQVVNAADGDCFFIFEDISDVASIDVTKNIDVITGSILMKEFARYLYFSCFSNDLPVGVRFQFNTDLTLNDAIQMETRNFNCKFSTPVHSTKGDYSVIDIDAACDYKLTEMNARVSLQGAELENGQISYGGDLYSAFNQSTKFENGVIKTTFAIPKDVSNGIDMELTFDLTLRDKGNESPMTRTSYFMIYDKSFDGSRPAISRGTVAMQVHPSERDVVYVRKGSMTRLLCEAYGNPKPTVSWYKGGRLQHGETDSTFGSWNKFYAYQRLIVKDFDSSSEGEYTCRVTGENDIEQRTKTLELCDPVNIQFSYSFDPETVNATFEAHQNLSNKIEHYSCFNTTRPYRDTWISDMDPSVTVVNINNDTYFRASISWSREESVSVPREIYCIFSAACKMDAALFKMNI